MQQILIDTLQQELIALQQQLNIVEKRADELEQTIAELTEKLAQAEKVQPEQVAFSEDKKTEPEIEVELIVDETIEEENSDSSDSIEIEEDIKTEDDKENKDDEILCEEFETEENTPDDECNDEEVEDAIKQKTTTNTQQTLLPPIDDIRKGISLGDRFLFQRELFASDGEKMNKTIDSLNKLNTLDDAMTYIAKHFNWDTESHAYELFLNLLKRRF